MVTEEAKIICLEDWKIRLEEDEDTKTAAMRIAGRERQGNWVRSSPVTEVFLTSYGWQIYTRNRKEIYQLRQNDDRIRGKRRLWGNLREKWSVLADRLPNGQRLFARLWEDFPDLWWDDIEEDREKLAKWSRNYGIEGDFQTLYLHCICLDKLRCPWGWSAGQSWQRQELPKKSGFFLCLNNDRAYCFEDLKTDEKAVWTRWKYISQEIREGCLPLNHLRANFECHGSPWKVYLTISYYWPEEGHVELVHASCTQVLLEKVYHFWKPGQRTLPGWFLDRKISLCNTGENPLKISGICEERKLRPGEAFVIELTETAPDISFKNCEERAIQAKEVERYDFCDR